ncbi:response regulator [Leucobacter soli]|uniref:Transcriptional regulatory protein LiaR n=1 Tax=Leucobacter soli TaxID=2812850 RepID=A0A916NKN7_9MICO|nr:response regulator transcription factor [Leucobacter soli]CAG7595058.1 Transcriptional regulatory protein LiaR [Leucobacter soli]
MTTVLIVDDQALIRQAVSDILATHEGISVVGQAADGAAAIELAARLRPDIVLMDIRMPGIDGIRATAEICADPELTGTRVLVLTTFEEDDVVVAALRAGASGFIGKGAEPEEIARAVQAVHAGEALLSPMATRGLITRYVLAEDLFISPHTAKTHVNRIMGKTHAHDRAQLVILAYECGLLAPGE